MTSTKTVPALEGELCALEKERTKIVEAIHGLRRRARDAPIVAAQTHASLNPQEISFWQKGIADNQRQLLELQAGIGALKKELRTLRKNPAISLRSSGNMEACLDHEGIYLSCFHQVARDSLDPRLFAALQKDAKTLAADHRRMNNNSL
jgi:hypothetical protein